MGVDGSVRESRDITKGVLSTSDNGEYVNQAEPDRTGFMLMPISGGFVYENTGSTTVSAPLYPFSRL